MSRKRANGEGMIRKRSNGTWEARITIRFDETTGKQVRKSIYGRTKKEVADKIASVKIELDGSPQNVDMPENITVGDWLNDWLTDYLADVKDGTVVSYTSICKNHLTPAFGKISLVDLRAPAIQKYYNGLKSKGVSPKYIKNIHGCFHRALDVAVKVDIIPKNPSSACVIPKVIKPEIKPLDIPEQRKLLHVLSSEFYGALVLVDIFTGMRVGEIIGLTWDCVDFNNGIIRVEKQMVQTRGKGQKYRFGTLKNDKSRVLAPAQYVMDELQKHFEKQKKNKEELGDLWNPGEFPNLVFTHPDGSHLSQPTVWKEFQKILEHAGLEHYRVHDLRHTFAVNSILAGDDIKTIQENMGHYSSAFTLDRYGHVTETMRKKSASRMENFIQSIKNDGGEKTNSGTVVVR